MGSDGYDLDASILAELQIWANRGGFPQPATLPDVLAAYESMGSQDSLQTPGGQWLRDGPNKHRLQGSRRQSAV